MDGYFQSNIPSSGINGSSVDISKVPSFVRTGEMGDKVFFVENGNAHWIKNPSTLFALGGDFKKVVSVDSLVFKALNTSVEPIDVTNAGKFGQLVPPPPPAEEKKKVEFKEYGDSSVMKHETIKGLTSITIPAYFLNFPVFHITGNCIGSIREHTDKSKTPYEIILVINGNKVMEFERLEDTYCDKVIVNKENVGPIKAGNQAIRIARGEYIAGFSNDIQVYDHWLEDMLEALQYLDYVMPTPMYGMPFARAVEANKLREKTLGKPIQETFHNNADGSMFVFRKSLMDEIGMQNEDLFHYKADVDFRKRMDKFGKKYAATNRVNIHHIIGATTIDQTAEELHILESDKAFYKLWGK